MLCKAILEIGGTLISVLDCYKNKKICNEVFDSYANALEFVSNYYKTLKKCNKAVYISPSAIQLFYECNQSKEMCKVVDACLFVFLIVLIDKMLKTKGI